MVKALKEKNRGRNNRSEAKVGPVLIDLMADL